MNHFFNKLGLAEFTVEIQSYGSLGSLGGLIPFVLFGFQERQNGYKSIIAENVNANTTITFTDTGTSYIFDYVPIFGFVNKGVIITCKEYPYPSLVYAIASNQAEILAIGYKVENNIDQQQFTEPLDIIGRDMFGKTFTDSINPSTFQRPENFIENLLIIVQKIKIDATISIQSFMIGRPFINPQPKITLYFFLQIRQWQICSFIKSLQDKISFFRFFKEQLEYLLTRKRLGSYKSQKTGYYHLSNYLSYKGKTDLLFEEITPLLIRDFETYLKGKEILNNSCIKYIKTFKSVYNEGVKLGKYQQKSDPFIVVKNKYSPVEKKTLKRIDNIKEKAHRDIPISLRAQGYFNH
jgi:hypothetical protein